jgi:hypothetical protein
MTASADVGSFTLLGGCSRLATHFIKWYAHTTELLALREETLSGKALHQQRLVLISELVPEIVKVSIVRTEDDVRKFV